MSIYNHVANKDDIIDGIVELAVSEIELPDINDHWKTAMRKRAVSAQEVLVRHPWATLVMVSRPNAGPAMLRYVNATLASLRGSGFSWEETDRIWNAMDSHIYGFTLQELNFPFDAPDYPDTAQDFLDSTDVSEFPFFNELARQVMKGRHSGVQDFTFGLELLLDGLEKHMK
jgi:AcrR family transcriptional regulator